MARIRKRSRPQLSSFLGNSNASLLPFLTIKALGVELEQMRGIILGLGGTTALLETHATGRSGLAIASRHGDELHQVQCNVFVATRSDRGNSWHVHERLPCSGNVRNDFVFFFFEVHKLFR